MKEPAAEALRPECQLELLVSGVVWCGVVERGIHDPSLKGGWEGQRARVSPEVEGAGPCSPIKNGLADSSAHDGPPMI